ncbi:hypothetical protein ACFY40_11375 [Streptomyces sp. NPDC012950]|uniref:hypothetical protein n=1 Tax=Streptomyces sp. NPDC012950 TaxID=3364858 RepID=UPI0036A72FB7
MKHSELLAAARRILWQTWTASGDDLASAGAQALLDAGMLVEPSGAAELERLRMLLNASPVELSEEQLGALIDAGNGAVSDYYHERACACSEYPAGCATNPAYRREFGYWDTDAFALGMGAVLGVWESIRTGAAPVEIAELPDRLAAVLTERFTELGNPFSEMRTQFQGPDRWPASKPVGPNGVAEVLRELLSEPTVGRDLPEVTNPAGLTVEELQRTPDGTYRCGCGHWDNVHGPFCFAESCECGDFQYEKNVEVTS